MEGQQQTCTMGCSHSPSSSSFPSSPARSCRALGRLSAHLYPVLLCALLALFLPTLCLASSAAATTAASAGTATAPNEGSIRFLSALPVASSLSFHEQSFVPEKAVEWENRHLGNLTSLLLDNDTAWWATREGEDAFLTRLLGRPIAAGILGNIDTPTHTHYTAAPTAATKRGGHVRSGAATDAGPAVHATRQDRVGHQPPPKLNIIYTKGVAETSPSQPLGKGSAEKEGGGLAEEVWDEIRSRSVLAKLRTTVLAASRGNGPHTLPRTATAQAAASDAEEGSGGTTAGTRATEALIEVHHTKAKVPVTMTGSQVTVISFDVSKGNTFNSIIQLPNWRYDSSVSQGNCYGMGISVAVRTNNPYASAKAVAAGMGQVKLAATATAATVAARTATTAGAADDDDDASSNEGGEYSSVWDSFAEMFDTSAFCEVKSSLGLRVTKADATRTYYVVLTTSVHKYSYVDSDDSVSDSCSLVVFLEQTSAKRQRTLQIIFALVVPLLLLFVPLPFQLWRGDIIQASMLNIDFADWIFYPPLLLRRKIVQGVVRLYRCVWSCLTARRARRQQATLEAQQRALAAQMEAQFEGNGSNGNGGRAEEHSARDRAASAPSGWGLHPVALAQPSPATAGPPSTVSAAIPPSPPPPAVAGGTAVNRPLYADNAAPSPAATPPAGSLLLRAMEPANATYAGAASDANHHRNAEEEEEGSSSARSSPIRLQDSFAASASHRQQQYQQVPREEREHLAAGEADSNGDGRKDRVPTRELLFSASACPTRSSANGKDGTNRVDVDTSAKHSGMEREGDDDVRKPQQPATSHVVKGSEESEDEEGERFCRICREDDTEEALVAPCSCTGSVRWVHRSCLDHWRLESTKRNLNNVNKCEICKHDFTIGIRKSTMFFRSAKNIVDGVLLFLTSFFAIFLIATLSHSTFGELSCLADYHDVSYKTMYLFEGLTLSVFLYLLCLILVLFSSLIVYSWFRSRPDVEAYINETHMMPPFLTSRNVALTLVMSGILTLQGLSLGYLVKFFLYSTSRIVWNWEASPLLGGMLFMLFMTVSLGFSVWLRDFVNTTRAGREGLAGAAQDVVVAAAENGNDGNAERSNNSANSNSANGREHPQSSAGEEAGGRGDNGAANTGAAAAAGAEDGRSANAAQGSPSADNTGDSRRRSTLGGAAPAGAAGEHAHAAAASRGEMPQPGQAGDEDYTGQFAIPPEQRVIRAYEYCPPRRKTHL